MSTAETQRSNLLERLAELDKANTDLAMESHRLRELLREVSCMMHQWDIGLDGYDGKDYTDATEIWDVLLPRIDDELSRTDPPTPQEIRKLDITQNDDPNLRG